MTTEHETPITPTYEFPEEADMQAFRADPTKACEGMQRKYLGQTYQEFLPSREALQDHQGEAPEWYALEDQKNLNPFTHEEKVIKVLVKLPEKSNQELIEEKIEELKIKIILGTISKEEMKTLELLTR